MGAAGITVRNYTREEAEVKALSLLGKIAFDMQTASYVQVTAYRLVPTPSASCKECGVLVLEAECVERKDHIRADFLFHLDSEYSEEIHATEK